MASAAGPGRVAHQRLQCQGPPHPDRRSDSLPRRLGNHGLIKKAGRSVIMTGLNIRETIVVPGLSTKHA